MSTSWGELFRRAVPAGEALVADSRVRDFQHPLYRRLGIMDACTWPDLAEPAEFRHVSLYHATRD